MIWTMRRRLLTVFSVAILGFYFLFSVKAQGQKPAGQTANTNRLPERTTIIKGVAARPLFKQCSRQSPVATAFWTPTVADVRAAEQALPAFIQSLKNPNGPDRRLRFDYRQYAGFVDKRSGHKSLYLNGFAPRIAAAHSHTIAPGKKPFDWKLEPLNVCDGGNSFWGAEYDVQTGQWSRFFFNGPF